MTNNDISSTPIGADGLVERQGMLLGLALLEEQKAENAFAPEGKTLNRGLLFKACKAAWKAYDDHTQEIADRIEALESEKAEREATREARRKTAVLLAGIPEPWKSVIIEQNERISALIAAVGEHVTVRSDYLARAQAAEQRLAEAVAALDRIAKSASAGGWRVFARETLSRLSTVGSPQGKQEDSVS
jgi:hypothetical protein